MVVTETGRGRALAAVGLALGMLLGTADGAGRAVQQQRPEGLVLSGALRAAEAEYFVVPRTSSWQIQLKWLIEEGTRVEPGDAVARLDPGNTEENLTEARDDLLKKKQEKVLHDTQARLDHLGLEVALAKAEAELAKARLDAEVPQDVLQGKDYRERQLEMQKKKDALDAARMALVAGEADRVATEFGDQLDIADLEESIKQYEEELDALVMRATRSGIVVHEEHPWFGRKFREGDRVQPSFILASIPNLETLQVRAWAMEPDLPLLALGQKARLYLDAFPSEEYEGEVIAVGASGQKRSQWGKAPYFPVTIRLERIDEQIMKPGMSVRCELEPAGEGVSR